MTIGICGGSGSGKTTLLKRLSAHYKHLNPSIFSMDNYYHSIENQQRDDRGYYNFDLPDALDEERLTEDLQKLIQGELIQVREYHFNTPPERHVLIDIHPSPLIIVEGLFLFHYKGLRKLLDYSIFIEVDHEVQLDRRLYRDQESRGYTREAILYQWENHVLPCYQTYLLPYRNQSNFVFRNDARAEEDFIRLTNELDNKITHSISHL